MKAAFRFVGIVFVTLLVLLDFGIIPTFAKERCLIGDADGDGLIMIVDCTLIQRDIAGLLYYNNEKTECHKSFLVSIEKYKIIDFIFVL